MMRKRDSRRRWKARARLGQPIPWAAIVDRQLANWGSWERDHQTMMAHLLPPPRGYSVAIPALDA